MAFAKKIMKYLVYLILISSLVLSCSSQKNTEEQTETVLFISSPKSDVETRLNGGTVVVTAKQGQKKADLILIKNGYAKLLQTVAFSSNRGSTLIISPQRIDKQLSIGALLYDKNGNSTHSSETISSPYKMASGGLNGISSALGSHTLYLLIFEDSTNAVLPLSAETSFDTRLTHSKENNIGYIVLDFDCKYSKRSSK